MNPTTAVEVFFVISGFYMQLVLSQKYTSDRLGKKWVIKFYGSRYTRLMPGYLVCLATTIAYLYISRDYFDLIEYPQAPMIVWGQIHNLENSVINIFFKVYLYITNIFLFFQDLILNVAVVGGQAQLTLNRSISDFYIPNGMPVPQAWSLGVELSFYAIAPFLLKNKNSYLITIFTLLLAIKLYFITVGSSSDLYYRSFPFALPYFMLGAIAYRFRDNLNVFKTDNFHIFQLLHVYFFVIAVSLMIPNMRGAYSVVLVVICGLYMPSLFHATKSNKLDRYIGEASYPIYIFHILFYMMAANNWRTFGWVATVLNIDHVQLIALLALTATVTFSAFFVWVELAFVNPIRNRVFERKYSGKDEDHKSAEPPKAVLNEIIIL